jgi:hypothetical protein
LLLSENAKWEQGVQHISALQHLQHLQLQSDATYLEGEDSPSIQLYNLQAPDLQALFT